MKQEGTTTQENRLLGQQEQATYVVQCVMNFLCLFMPVTLSKRVVGVLLIALGVPAFRVRQLTGLCERSIRSLKKDMREKDIASLFKIKKGSGRKSKTADMEQEILAELEQGNYYTRQQIADMIEEKFHIRLSVSAVARLLKKNKIRKLKCASLPAKADVVKQREFYENTLHPLMKRAQDGLETLLFLDASHFVMGCDFLGRVYSQTRRFVKTFSGRKRYNVLGAIDFVTKQVLTVTNDTYITATQICEMLQKISETYAGKTVHIILDNARYQKCAVVEEFLRQLPHIQLIYIPPYSPNLNLIERLWKFVKGELRSRYYDQFGLFSQKIDSILESTTQENKDKVDKLIGEKVQLFDHLQCACENTSVNFLDRERVAA